jgi:small-conductance mechanosensitive channel
MLTWFSMVFRAVIIMTGFIVAGHLSRNAFARVIVRDDARRDLWILLDRAAYAGILGVGAVCALGTAGFNVTPLIAALGLSGFVLGFALRDTLSNAVAGLMILMNRPFVTGDTVAVAGFEGKVAGTDLRYTALEADGKRYLVPNATVLNSPVTVTLAAAKSDSDPTSAA